MYFVSSEIEFLIEFIYWPTPFAKMVLRMPQTDLDNVDMCKDPIRRAYRGPKTPSYAVRKRLVLMTHLFGSVYLTNIYESE